MLDDEEEDAALPLTTYGWRVSGRGIDSDDCCVDVCASAAVPVVAVLVVVLATEVEFDAIATSDGCVGERRMLRRSSNRAIGW